jgi:hypothetical protein
MTEDVTMSEQKQVQPEQKPAPRKEYTLKKALVQGRKVRQPEGKVMLRDDQAEWLRAQGVI